MRALRSRFLALGVRWQVRWFAYRRFVVRAGAEKSATAKNEKKRTKSE